MSQWCPEEIARSIVFGKRKTIKIESLWHYKPKYQRINKEWVPALVRQRDQCRVAMPHLEMSGDPAEFEVALAVIREVKRLAEETV
jgi:hypothetical protein